jgi:hypothetical protein
LAATIEGLWKQQAIKLDISCKWYADLPLQAGSPFCEIRNYELNLGVCLLMTSSVIEVAQQSKARRKDDFLIAFSPVIAEATATAYKGATNEVQQKLRRVVEVWRARQIFETPIQDAIETRIDGIFYWKSIGMSIC